MVGMPDLGETIGSTIGGIGGWVIGGGKGELTEEQTLAKAVREKKANYLPTRIKPPKVEEASPFADMTSSAETGKPEVKVDSSGLGETSGQKAKLVTKMQAAKDEAAAGAGTGRRVILAGEGIDPMRTESAGSAAQATEADLRRLASAGDASARQELVRRRLQRGVTDYRNVPLPKGGPGSQPEAVPPEPAPKTPLPDQMRTSGALPERRSAPREVQGPDLMRTARAQELRTQLQDPSLSARDRRIMQDQLDDIKNHPFERHEGGDIQSMKKTKTRMSRKEAEAGTEARKAGRKARFGGPPVPEE
jgi:hypothetical protein